MLQAQKRLLLYARVSTLNCDQKPEVQLQAMRDYCSSRGWTDIQQLVDHGYSGAATKRPGLISLMALARARKIDTIVIVKLDRLFRSLQHLLTTISELSEIGVELISLNDQLDMTTASGKLMLHIIGAFSEFERSLISQRTIAGLEFAKSRGIKLGRPKTRDDPEIQKLRAQGLSYRAIAKKLKCSLTAVHRGLNPVSKSCSESTQTSPTVPGQKNEKLLSPKRTHK